MKKKRSSYSLTSRPAGKQRSRGATLSIGVLVILIGAAMFYVGYNAPNNIPGRSYYTIYAKMNDADNLEDHDAVAVGGATNAGQVLSEKVVDHKALLEIQLAARYGPLRSSTKATIRLRSAVGTKFLDIHPGLTGSFLKNGTGVLAVSQTAIPVNLDQALDVFQAPVRSKLQGFVSNLGEGLAGRGLTVNQLINQTPQFVTTLGAVSEAINARAQILSKFVGNASSLADAFEPVRYNLANGFKPGTQALQPFINQRSSVQNTLEQAPSTLATANSQLPAVDALVTQVNGLAHAAEPTLADAPSAFADTTQLLRTAEPGLRSANQTLHLVHRAVSPTLGFLHNVQPELPRINETINDARVQVKYLDPRACALTDAFAGWANFMSLGTDEYHFIRFTVRETSNLLTDQPAPLNVGKAYPYPGACTNGSGEVGYTFPSPEQAIAHLNAIGFATK